MSLEDLKTYIQGEIDKKMETQDILSSLHLNEEYVSYRGEAQFTKSCNTIVLNVYLNVLKDTPNTVNILTIDEPYRPKKKIVSTPTINGSSSVYLDITEVGGIRIVKEVTKGTIAINATWQI